MTDILVWPVRTDGISRRAEFLVLEATSCQLFTIIRLRKGTEKGLTD
jgi:hypothetical protein